MNFFKKAAKKDALQDIENELNADREDIVPAYFGAAIIGFVDSAKFFLVNMVCKNSKSHDEAKGNAYTWLLSKYPPDKYRILILDIEKNKIFVNKTYECGRN